MSEGPWTKYQTANTGSQETTFGPWLKYQSATTTVAAADDAPEVEQQGMVSGIIDKITRGLTMGFGEELTAAEAALLGKNPEGDWFNYGKTLAARYRDALNAENEQQDQFSEDHPVTSAIAEIGGALATGAGAAKAGLTLTKSGATGLSKAGRGFVEGAGYGAVAGAGYSDGDLIENAKDAAAGALVGGAVGVALPAAMSAAGNVLAKRLPVRTMADLRNIKNQAYKQVDESGFSYSSDDIKELGQNIQSVMKVEHINPARHPKAASMMDDISRLGDDQMSLTDLDQLRQVVSRDVARAVDKSDARLGKIMLRQIDDFIDEKGGGDLIKSARAAHSTLLKAQELQKAVRKGELRAASTGSGGNADNAVRQNVRRILEKAEDGGASYTPEEKALLERIVVGSASQNALRLGGKLSPSGNGLLAALSLGATAMNPVFAIPGAIGIVSKTLADRATTTNVASLRKAIHGVAGSAEEKKIAARLVADSRFMRALTNAASVDAAEIAVEVRR